MMMASSLLPSKVPALLSVVSSVSMPITVSASVASSAKAVNGTAWNTIATAASTTAIL